MDTNERIGGGALIAAAAGSVLAMAHHPTGAGPEGMASLVHGAMIALVGTMAFGFAIFAAVRGPARPTILAGLIAYTIGLIGNIGAATINGFIVPELGGHQAAIGHDIFLLAWEVNQSLAKLGVFATGLAFSLWSIDFLTRERVEARIIGVVGLLAGIAPAVGLLTGLIDMDLAGAGIIYTVHAAWTVLVGLHMIRGRASDA